MKWKYETKKIIQFMILISWYENNLEALSETVRKIYDFKKASLEKFTELSVDTLSY